METVLRGENLCRRYMTGEVTVNALAGATFSISSGEFIVVLGPSGSGKSTLLNILGGMDRPDEGVLMYGQDNIAVLSAKKLSEYRRDVVGFVFQFFNLIPSLTARENVALAASIAKNPLTVDDALEQVGLLPRGSHFPAQLSGGEQQRVAIARAIVKNPALLLCDEPTGALDSENGRAVVILLEKVRRTLNCPVITITHNPAMAAIADRVFHMKDGRIDAIDINPRPMAPEEMEW